MKMIGRVLRAIQCHMVAYGKSQVGLSVAVATVLCSLVVSCRPGQRDAAIDGLVADLDSASVEVSAAAAVELERQYDRAAPRLRALFDELPPRAKLKALCIIVRQDDEPGVLKALHAFMRSGENPSADALRGWPTVIGILGERGIVVPVDCARPWLESADPQARVAALQLLRAMPNAFDCAFASFTDPDPDVRIVALQVASEPGKSEAQRRQLVTELVRMYERSDGTTGELNTIAVSLAVEADDAQAETLLLVLSDKRLSEEMRHWIACIVLKERALADSGCYRQSGAEVVAAARRVLEDRK